MSGFHWRRAFLFALKWLALRHAEFDFVIFVDGLYKNVFNSDHWFHIWIKGEVGAVKPV